MPNYHEPADFDAFNDIVSQVPPDVLLAISFHTPWATPCIQMNQVFKALAESRPDTDKTIFISVNAEELPDISEEYGVSAVPFFVLSKNKTVQQKVAGADPVELRKWVDQLSKGSDANAANTGGASLPPQQQTTAAPLDSAAALGNGGADNGEPIEEESINERLTKLVSAAPVMLFMKGTPAAPECGFSRKLVGMLRERGVRYGFFNILKDEEVRQGLKEFSDWPTFPQLYHKGELIGGLDIVKEEFERSPDFLKEESVNQD